MGRRFRDERAALIRAGVLDAWFQELDRAINQAGIIPLADQIIDARLIAVARQRNFDGERAGIKVPQEGEPLPRHVFETNSEQCALARQEFQGKDPRRRQQTGRSRDPVRRCD